MRCRRGPLKRAPSLRPDAPWARSRAASSATYEPRQRRMEEAAAKGHATAAHTRDQPERDQSGDVATDEVLGCLPERRSCDRRHKKVRSETHGNLTAVRAIRRFLPAGSTLALISLPIEPQAYYGSVFAGQVLALRLSRLLENRVPRDRTRKPEPRIRAAGQSRNRIR